MTLLDNLKIVETNIERRKLAFLSSVIVAIIAHGYRFSNLLLSHDSLNILEYKTDLYINNGRFTQLLLIPLRGALTTPWLFCILGCLWLAISDVLVCEIFNIKTPIYIILTSCIMCCNPAVTLTNATYVQAYDLYMFSLLLSVISAWLFLNNKKKSYRIYSVIVLMLSIGIYQAYMGVAIGIVLFSYITKLFKCEDNKEVSNKNEINILKVFFKDCIKYILCIISSALLYIVIWKLLIAISKVKEAHYAVNSMSSVGTILYSLYRTYKNVAIFFRRPNLFNTGANSSYGVALEWCIVIINIALIAYLGLRIIYKSFIKDKAYIRGLLQLVIIAVLPLGINSACFMAKGEQHGLTVYPIIMLYVFAISWLDNSDIKVNIKKVSIIGLAVISFVYVIYANQIYLKKQIQDEFARYEMTKLLINIENMDGYERGVTPVIVAGNPNDNDYYRSNDYFDCVYGVGVYSTCFTYARTLGFYANYVLCADVNMYVIDTNDLMYKVGDPDESNWNPGPITYDDVESMPAYPKEGSVKMINGAVVIRTSETNTVY